MSARLDGRTDKVTLRGFPARIKYDNETSIIHLNSLTVLYDAPGMTPPVGGNSKNRLITQKRFMLAL